MTRCWDMAIWNFQNGRRPPSWISYQPGGNFVVIDHVERPAGPQIDFKSGATWPTVPLLRRWSRLICINWFYNCVTCGAGPRPKRRRKKTVHSGWMPRRVCSVSCPVRAISTSSDEQLSENGVKITNLISSFDYSLNAAGSLIQIFRSWVCARAGKSLDF